MNTTQLNSEAQSSIPPGCIFRDRTKKMRPCCNHTASAQNESQREFPTDKGHCLACCSPEMSEPWHFLRHFEIR